MRTIPMAITWELFKRCRWSLLTALLGSNLIALGLFTALRREGPLPSDDPSTIMMHLLMMLLNLFIFGMALMQFQGSAARLFIYPVRSSTIVMCHFLPSMLLMALQSIFSISLVNALYDFHWPLWGPTLSMAVSLTAIQATLWLTEKSAWAAFAFALVSGCLGIWFKSRYGAALAAPSQYWVELRPSEIIVMLAIALMAYFVGVIAIQRNRQGAPAISLGIVHWIQRAVDRPSVQAGRFRSPAQAQRWFEWHQKLHVMPMSVIFGILVGVSIWLIFSRRLEDLYYGFLAGGGFLSAAALIGGVVFGNTGAGDENPTMGPFLASRPLTNRDYARTILITALLSLILAWLIWVAAFFLVYLLITMLGASPQEGIPQNLGSKYWPATLLGPWVIMSALAVSVLAGRPALLTKLVCAALAVFLLVSTFSLTVLSSKLQVYLSHSVAIIGGALLIAVTVWLFVQARRRLLIRLTGIAGGICGWAALVALVMWWYVVDQDPISVAILFVGLAAIAVAPLAGAPLALAWNRTR